MTAVKRRNTEMPKVINEWNGAYAEENLRDLLREFSGHAPGPEEEMSGSDTNSESPPLANERKRIVETFKRRIGLD